MCHMQKTEGFVVVVQSLAAAHEHHMPHMPGIAQKFVRSNDLPQHFGGIEIAYTAIQSAGAELAAHTAADLRADA